MARIRKTSYSKSQRKTLYKWAWKQKGKGSISKIGSKMAYLKRQGGSGSKIAIKQLGLIGDLKSAFNAGVKSASIRRRRKK